MTYQMTIFPEEYIEQANALCQAEWIISPFIHNLVLLVAQEYQKRDIPPEKFDYVSIPERALFCYSVDDPGGNYYSKVHELFEKIAEARIFIEHTNGDLEQVQIFRGRTYYSKKRREIKVCLNQDLYDFWIDLHALYAKLPLTDMLSLPNTKYSRLMYQLVASFKYLGQKEMDFDAFKRIMHCKTMAPGIFNRDVLAPCHKQINKTSLHFDYDFVRGAHNKIEKIRFVFPGVKPKALNAPVNEQPTDIDADIKFSANKGNSVHRENETTIVIDGFVDCWKWVKDNKGSFNNKKIIFPSADTTDRFIAICQRCNIPVV